jgi:hypothetical protein
MEDYNYNNSIRKTNANPTFELISSSAVIKDENEAYNSVYSVLGVYVEDGIAEALFVYDVSRTKETGEYILSETVKKCPSRGELKDFISELL